MAITTNDTPDTQIINLDNIETSSNGDESVVTDSTIVKDTAGTKNITTISEVLMMMTDTPVIPQTDTEKNNIEQYVTVMSDSVTTGLSKRKSTLKLLALMDTNGDKVNIAEAINKEPCIMNLIW